MANKAGVICQVWSLNVLESPEMKKDRIGGTLPIGREVFDTTRVLRFIQAAVTYGTFMYFYNTCM